MLRGIFCIQRGTGLQTAMLAHRSARGTPPEIGIHEVAVVGKVLGKSSFDEDRRLQAIKPCRGEYPGWERLTFPHALICQ
jgi:hypothetical protein